MIFTLEALEAKHGDSLLLHYGPKANPQLIIIDGGPPQVFDNSLRPRLEEIKAKRSPTKPLPVRLMMVSHIDADHICGILDLTNALIEQKQSKPPKPLLCDITTLWHNSFDEILGNNETDAISAAVSSAVRLSAAGELTFPPGLFNDRSAAAIAASVSQGRELRNNADLLTRTNDPFPGLVNLPQKGAKPVSMGDDLTFLVIGPSQTRLEKLEKDWDKKLKELQKKKPAEARALAAEFIDRSVYNLSSIVVLAEANGKTMLLTGDGLAKDILEGLNEAGLLKEGETLHVHLLKMPHHGSRRNVTEEFLSTVTADHYVLSANGRDKNPDLETLEMLSKVRGSVECTIHLTNPVPHAVEFFKSDQQKADKKYKVRIREIPALSIKIDLGEPFDG